MKLKFISWIFLSLVSNPQWEVIDTFQSPSVYRKIFLYCVVFDCKWTGLKPCPATRSFPSSSHSILGAHTPKEKMQGRQREPWIISSRCAGRDQLPGWERSGRGGEEKGGKGRGVVSKWGTRYRKGVEGRGNIQIMKLLPKIQNTMKDERGIQKRK